LLKKDERATRGPHWRPSPKSASHHDTSIFGKVAVCEWV